MDLTKEIEKCDELYENGKYSALIEKCDEILDENPDTQQAMGYKGIALLFLGQCDDAMEVLERGVELYPENYYLKNNLAMVYYEKGDYETALKLCEEGLKIKDFDWLCENKYRCLLRLGRFDEAIEFEDSIEHHDLPLICVFLEEGMEEPELEYHLRILKDNPDDYYSITIVKMNSAKLGRKPDVGDHYLKWIDLIEDDGSQITVKGDDEKLVEYASFEIKNLTSRLEDDSGMIEKSLYALHDELPEYSDEEFSAIISRLVEVGYLTKTSDGHVKLTGKPFKHE